MAARRAEFLVGVGASAGGLEAMLTFFGQVRPNGRIGYVVAQHMAGDAHSDLVAKLIGRQTSLQVVVGTEGLLLEPDHIVVVPAGSHGTARDGTLHLLPPSPQQVSTPSVDVLFESLAGQFGANAAGVVLSGAGWDGARGCTALLRNGGKVGVQDLGEAAFSGMPEAAAASRGAQRRKAAELGPWIASEFGVGSRRTAPAVTARGNGATVDTLLADDPPAEALDEVTARVREVTHIDFSEYRPETLLRRLQARRSLLGLDEARYRDLLLRDDREANQLQKLFLVSFSSFWRDRECFDTLAAMLAPRLERKSIGSTFTVWVAGCASGEEAFTLAALITDLPIVAARKLQVMVVGSDLNDEALEQARTGRFPLKSVREAPSGWADRWLQRADSELSVRAALADRVHFELADIELGLPTRLVGGELDLISCRNMLIYFRPEKQQRLLARFGQTLRPDGLLFIGPSETLGAPANAMFRTLHAEHRIYARRT